MGERVRERGSIVPLVALLVVLVGVLCLGIGRLGGAAVAASRARTAADAAALAGAAAGRGEAAVVAKANGATLVDAEEDGDTFTAVVRLGDEEARARAESQHVVSGAGGAARAGLDPALVAALTRAGERLGAPVPITSGWRSAAHQQALWARRATNRYPVARPGTSPHERGLAVDVALAIVPRLAAIAADVGLCWPLPRADPVHFELCRSTPAGR